MAAPSLPDTETRVLLLAPTRRDAEITCSFLAKQSVACVVCRDLSLLRCELELGAGAILMTEEVFALREIGDLILALEAQPSWSDLPIVLLVRDGAQSPVATKIIQKLRNVIVLERPSATRSVVSAVRAAIRARVRQYQIRDQIWTVSQAQAVSRQLQAELALAVDASGLGIFHCEMPLGTIRWDDRCKAHFWLPPEAEVDFARFYSILHPDDREPARRAFEACVYDGKPYEITYRTVSPRGEIRWVRATGRTYHGNGGEPLRFDGTTQDVTERERLLQSERTARAEAERADRIKDEFLATLSHELRTPLTAVLGWASMLRRQDLDLSAQPKELSEGLAVIERNARAQHQIIEDLLEMSRIISGKLRLDVQRVEIPAVLEAALATVRPAAVAKGIRFEPVINRDVPPLLGDPGRLQQVFWNLLANAVKFTPGGGRVQVCLRRLQSDIEVSVTDNGKGIAAEFLPHIFERFRQADGSSNRPTGGLGLGLAIVKELVELHGGNVRAYSPGPGEGTTFTVMLPLTSLRVEPEADSEPNRVQANPSVPLQAALVSLRGVRILVVDDEEDARDLIRRLLEAHGASVRAVASASQALESIQTEEPDVLVSDIGMPEEDGYALIRRVRSLPSGSAQALPAVAITAYARAEDRSKAMLAGFQRHVSKPIEPSELLSVIASVTSRISEPTNN